MLLLSRGMRSLAMLHTATHAYNNKNYLQAILVEFGHSTGFRRFTLVAVRTCIRFYQVFAGLYHEFVHERADHWLVNTKVMCFEEPYLYHSTEI